MKPQSKNIFSVYRIVWLFVLFAVFGASYLPQISVVHSPKQQAQQLDVTVNYAERVILDAEQQITALLETYLSSLAGLEQTESTTNPTNATIQLRFQNEVDIQAVRLETSALLRQIYRLLPPDVSYPTIVVSSVGDTEN